MTQTSARNASKARRLKEESFSFGSGTTYADNAEYAEKGLRFDILTIEFQPGRGYEGRDRWALTITTQGREREIMTLGSNPKRDEQLREAQAHLKRHGKIQNVHLRRSGDTYYLVNGE